MDGARGFASCYIHVSCAGEVTLRDLKLRREALDKFNLPVDVLEGKPASQPAIDTRQQTLTRTHHRLSGGAHTDDPLEQPERQARGHSCQRCLCTGSTQK